MLVLRMPQQQSTSIEHLDNHRMTEKMSFRENLLSFAAVTSSKSSLSKYSSEAPTTTFFASRQSTKSPYSNVNSRNAESPHYFDEIPKLVKTPWEADRTRKSTIPRNRRPATGRSLPESVFRDMPDEIYECIVRQLEALHFSDDAAGTCINCYTRDLYNVSLTSHTWYRAARQQLYSKIWLNVNESTTSGSTPLLWHSIRLLRRTLRERPILARHVKELHFPDAQLAYQSSHMKGRQTMINNLASLVMAAPNLEKFSGLYLTYDHVFDRLTHALSTRTELREKLWVLRRSDIGLDDEGVYWSNHDEFGQADNHDAFLRCHDNWTKLETLCLFGQTTGRMDYRSFVATFRSLQSLKHLLISDFDASQFTDRTLAAFPPSLRSLRLQDVSGVTEKGLQRFFSSATGKGLQCISLVKMEISSALLISGILAGCLELKRFTIAQNISPSLPLGLETPNRRSALYASRSLQYLHWDIIAYGPSLQDLASSISLNALPSLRTLRAPSDDGGVLQRLCAPSNSLSHPADVDSVYNEEENPFEVSSLPSSRCLAQKRKDDASKDPFISIVVSNEEGVVQHTYTLRTYMGTLSSQIRYHLESDIPGSSDAIAGLNDLLVTRDVIIEGNGERFCGDEAGRGSFESGGSNSTSSALSLRGRKNTKSLGRDRKEAINRGHRMNRILTTPDMRVFF